MQHTIKWIDNLNKGIGYILASMLGVMSILIIVQVFSRFVINYPLHWTEELARYLMIYCVFFGAALALRNHRLVAIEVLSESISEGKRRILRIAVMVITIVFSVILLVQGFAILEIVQTQSSAGLGISMAFPYAAIPLGALLLIINAIAVIFDTLLHGAEKEGL